MNIVGILLPLGAINNLGEAKLTEIYIAGEEEEDDESFRARIEEKINMEAFGGNIADYLQYVKSIEGIGNCLVIPIWNGGGTVKLIIVTSSYEIPSEAKINEVQTLIDPTQNSGLGYGIAPIGHKVTVVAPEKLDISISCNITLEVGQKIEPLKKYIEDSIKDCILELQEHWFEGKELRIFLARITSAILDVQGVVNVENIKINGKDENFIIDPLSENNPYPVLKEVTFDEN